MTIWEIIALAKAGKGAKSMLHFKGSVLNESALPDSGNEGDTYLVDSEDSYFAWDGEGWTDVGQLLSMDDVAALFDQVEDAGDEQVARIAAKGQEVEESIPEDYTELSADVGELKSAINTKAPVIINTASGAIASFEDGANGMPIKALTVNIEPVQSGSGDPSPTNVRPISGWTRCNIVVSPTSDAQDGNTYNITFPTEAGTVYSGTLDVTSGVLTVTHKYKVFDGTEQFAQYTNTGTTQRYGYTADDAKSNVKFSVVSNAYKSDNGFVTAGGVIDIYNNCIGGFNKTVRFAVPYATANDFKAELAAMFSIQTPVEIIYELAAPIPMQLTPTEVTTLLGTNNIWADCGPVSVDYPADTKMYIDAQTKNTCSLIAGIETSMTASKAYVAGDMLIVGNTLYKVAAPISSGAALTPGTNVNATTVSGQIIYIASKPAVLG